MAARDFLSTEQPGRASERLQGIAAEFAGILKLGGRDAATIRRTVLEVANRVIKTLTVDDYRVETHIAVVQRAIDAFLDAPAPISEAQ
jgi:hypothetical protein